MDFFKIKLYFGTFLIGLEVLWMIWYTIMNSLVEEKTKDDPQGGLIRSEAFTKGVHIGVILAIILVIATMKRHVHIYIISIFLFEIVRDTFSVLNTTSNDYLKNTYPDLYKNMLAISIYQLVLATLASVWCAVVIWTNPSELSALEHDVQEYHKHHSKELTIDGVKKNIEDTESE